MGDIIRALTEMIDKIGITAAMIVVVIIAATYVVMWNKRLIDTMQSFSEKTVRDNTLSMNANTAANQTQTQAVAKLTEYMHKFGSDPLSLCKVEQLRTQIEKLIAVKEKLEQRLATLENNLNLK